MAKATVGITMGDPAGIGPEIALKAVMDSQVQGACRPVIVGSRAVLEKTARSLEMEMRIVPFDGSDAPESDDSHVAVLDLSNCAPGDYGIGEVSAVCGRAAADYIERAVELALDGTFDAIVTGPIHKESLRLGGVRYPGHTEMLAHLTKTSDYAMMLAAGSLRVAHVTTHTALRNVPDKVTRTRVLSVIRLTHAALVAMGIQSPRIAAAGLNPHCGENGLFGDEDAREIRPAVEDARREGIDADGPIPGDTVFVKAAGGGYDAVIAMYHDQGHIPVKLAGFKVDPESGEWTEVSGVNVTLGLPIIRTSVDHGTAFDIAGKGVANHRSMVDAILLAAEMSGGSRL